MSDGNGDDDDDDDNDDNDQLRYLQDALRKLAVKKIFENEIKVVFKFNLKNSQVTLIGREGDIPLNH